MTVPEIGRVYILDHLKETVRAEWKRQKKSGYVEEDIQAEADTRLAALSHAECEDLLRGMMPELERKEIARIIEDNFYAIRGDIRKLIEQECPDREEEAYVEETISMKPSNTTQQ